MAWWRPVPCAGPWLGVAEALPGSPHPGAMWQEEGRPRALQTMDQARQRWRGAQGCGRPGALCWWAAEPAGEGGRRPLVWREGGCRSAAQASPAPGAVGAYLSELRLLSSPFSPRIRGDRGHPGAGGHLEPSPSLGWDPELVLLGKKQGLFSGHHLSVQVCLPLGRAEVGGRGGPGQLRGKDRWPVSPGTSPPPALPSLGLHPVAGLCPRRPFLCNCQAHDWEGEGGSI